MRDLTPRRRIPILAIAALVITGCAAPAASTVESPLALASPSAEPSVAFTPNPIPTYANIPTPVPTEAPEACPATLDPNHVVPELASDNGGVFVELAVTSITAIGSSEQLPLPPPPGPSWLPAFLVGGHEAELSLSYSSEPWVDVVATAFTVSIAADGQAPVGLIAQLHTKADGSIVAVVTVPNQRVRGTINVSVAWHDACFAMTATTSQRLLVDKPYALRDCAEGSNGAFAELDHAFAPRMGVGGLDVPLRAWRFIGKVAPLPVVDPLPPYVGFRRDTPIVAVAPGATIGISPQHPDLALSAPDPAVADYYQRRPLIRWLEGGWIHGSEPDAPVVLETPLVRNADGTFSFTAPTEPGRYAAEVIFDYDSACSFGMAGFVVGIDVIAPAPSASPSA